MIWKIGKIANLEMLSLINNDPWRLISFSLTKIIFNFILKKNNINKNISNNNFNYEKSRFKLVNFCKFESSLQNSTDPSIVILFDLIFSMFPFFFSLIIERNKKNKGKKLNFYYLNDNKRLEIKT